MMQGDPWAARDLDGDLNLFDGEPHDRNEKGYFSGHDNDTYLCGIPDEMLPDLRPGEKCRVTIVMEMRS